MSHDRFRRIEELFHAAQELQPQERASFLGAACKGDADLQREVESLLNQSSESPLDGRASERVPSLLASHPALAPGAQLGPYRVVGVLGSGGMGEVYRANDARLRREVAIKVLPDHLAHDSQARARFEREARAVAALNHSHICALYDVGPDYLVMELVEGPTLAERIARGSIPVDESLGIALQIAEALEAAHEKGVVHRDLKPGNIKVTPDGTVKVLDFGLAKMPEPSSAEGTPRHSPTVTLEQVTRAGIVLGTAAYMSPEQARGASVDKRADIWAFGCVLYEMLTGKRAFVGETVSDTLVSVMKTEPDLSRVPDKTRKLLRLCLQKDPKLRLRDIGDARILLDETPMAPPRRRILPWVIAGTMAVIALIASVLVWRATRPVNKSLLRLSLELPDFAITPAMLTPGPSVILSPDGTRIVYTGRSTDGVFRLYTRTLDREQSTTLEGTEGAYGPFFSPDGQAVGFFAEKKLKTISIAGGVAMVLCDALSGLGGSWGDDGNIIAAVDNFAGSSSGLLQIASSGGPVNPVRERSPEGNGLWHTWPQILPGAQVVLDTTFSTTMGTFEQATIEAHSLRTGEKKTLLRGGYYGRYLPSGHLMYMHGGTLYSAPMDVKRLALTGPPVPVIEEVAGDADRGFAQMDISRSGTLVYVRGKARKIALTWLDSSGQTRPLGAAPAQYEPNIFFAPDGKRLALSWVERGNDDVRVYDWERDTMTRLTFTGSDGVPVWSPDGKHIAFSSTKGGGADNLYWMRADGAGEAVRLTEGKNSQYAFSFSPDGKRLVFAEIDPHTNVDLWTLPLEGAESDYPRVGKPEPLLVTPFNEMTPMISPDGHWLAYCSDESGRNEIYVRPFPGPGGKWQISTAGGDRPVWSKKAPELFYRSSEGMMVASYTANVEAFAASKPRLWAAKKDLGGFFDLAPDGKRFVVGQSEGSEQNTPTRVTFLLNFADELQRRVPARK